jgi:hypothetical protein
MLRLFAGWLVFCTRLRTVVGRGEKFSRNRKIMDKQRIIQYKSDFDKIAHFINNEDNTKIAKRKITSYL